MQRNAVIIILTVSTCLLLSCTKKNIQQQPVASLRVVNAVIGGGDVKLNTNQRDSALTYNSKPFGVQIVDNEVDINIWPTMLPGKQYYNEQVEMQNGDLYSLFLFGQQSGIESLLIQEQVPERYSDSVVGIRIAHCALGIGQVNVALKSTPTVPVFQGIGYKTISNIVKIPLPGVLPIGAATLEVRDALDNKLLTSYTLPTSVNSLYPGVSVALQRFKNITLVIKGSRDTLSGPNTLGIFPSPMSY